jgi:hypothetical protein
MVGTLATLSMLVSTPPLNVFWNDSIPPLYYPLLSLSLFFYHAAVVSVAGSASIGAKGPDPVPVLLLIPFICPKLVFQSTT